MERLFRQVSLRARSDRDAQAGNKVSSFGFGVPKVPGSVFQVPSSLVKLEFGTVENLKQKPETQNTKLGTFYSELSIRRN